jgi:hypothetical protein
VLVEDWVKSSLADIVLARAVRVFILKWDQRARDVSDHNGDGIGIKEESIHAASGYRKTW